MRIYKRDVKNSENYKSCDIRWEKLMLMGARLGCHQMPERSFFVRGYQFPLCARCTGLMLGYIVAIATWHFIDVLPTYSVLMCFPLILDGTTQYIHLRESNQILRFTTGVLCGIGSVRLEIMLMIMIANFIGGRITR